MSVQTLMLESRLLERFPVTFFLFPVFAAISSPPAAPLFVARGNMPSWSGSVCRVKNQIFKTVRNDFKRKHRF